MDPNKEKEEKMRVIAILCLLIIALSFLLKGNRPKNKPFIYSSCFLMFCVMGLRNVLKYGNDSASSYYHQYQRIHSANYPTLSQLFYGDYNTGFRILMKFCDSIGLDYQGFVIIIAAFVMISFAFLINKYSVSPVQSICYYMGLLIYIFMFDALKQTLAMAVIIYAFDAIMEKKPIRFYIFVIIASFFHFPALVFLPAYLISEMRLDGEGYFIMLGCLMLFTFLFRTQIINLMFDTYSKNETVEFIDLSGSKFLSNKVIVMLVIVLAALVFRPPTKSDTLYNVLLKFMGVAIVLQTFCVYNNIFERLADYYFFYSVIFIPLVFENKKLKVNVLGAELSYILKSIAPLLICLFSIWRFVRYVGNSPIYSNFYWMF